MDDDGLGAEQARPLLEVIGRAGIKEKQLWFHYFTLGGSAGQIEVEAYLHDCLGLAAFQRDLLAHAANELIDHGIGGHAPYAWELLDGDQ
ncbi:MAG TPA: hypothetical protein VK903_07950 [Propionicimonas sp.]|nr:hypothetical protein [Propionicimonas sp.]